MVQGNFPAARDLVKRTTYTTPRHGRRRRIIIENHRKNHRNDHWKNHRNDHRKNHRNDHRNNHRNDHRNHQDIGLTTIPPSNQSSDSSNESSPKNRKQSVERSVEYIRSDAMSGEVTTINVRYPSECYIWRGINYPRRAPLRPEFECYIWRTLPVHVGHPLEYYF